MSNQATATGTGSIHGLSARTGDKTPLGQFVPSGKFGRMFAKLAPLFVSNTTGLVELGNAMLDATPASAAGDHPNLPAGYTYLGQFIDHDITFDTSTLQETLIDPLALENFRTPALDLDCMYGAGPGAHPQLYQRADPSKFEIGLTSSKPGDGDPSAPVSQPFDLPRGPNGFATIGDPRNDENLVVAQTHVLFLRFHNAVVDAIRAGAVKQESPIRKTEFEEARDLVIWHYQWIVLHDFLARVIEKDTLDMVLGDGATLYGCNGPCACGHAYIPVEFAGAAYRLGHSMIRESYDYNRVFRAGGVTPATLQLLFKFSGRSGSGGDVPIPSDWIIDWRRFFELDTAVTVNKARKLDPFLADPLKNIPNVPSPSSLAVRNLLRGNSLGLPPGQSICRLWDIPSLTPAEISTGPDGNVAKNHSFHIETPLWYYILKEADIKHGGERLGPLGSRILAEVFVGLLECDTSSFLSRKPQWTPVLPSAVAGDFTMADLVRFAGPEGINPIG